MRFTIAFLLILLSPIASLSQSIGVGEWQIHLPYNNTIEVAEAGSRIYCATGSAVFYYDKADNSLTRMSKVSGLSDVSVSTIAYQESGDVLVVAYSNANIDVVKAGVVYNVSDIKRKSILGDKSINSITIDNGFAYLACGFGIVALDLSKNEIKDTYYISVTQDPVNQVVIQGDTMYAASDIGLYKALLLGSNLSDFNSWSPVAGISSAAYNSITSLNGKLFIVQSNSPDTIKNDSILARSTNGAWFNFDSALEEEIHRVQASYSKIVVAAKGSVLVYDESGVLLSSYTKPVDPQHAIFDRDGNIWIADFYAGLIQNEADWGIYPNGPGTDRAFDMAVGEEDLWVAPGGRTGSWHSSYITDGIFNYIGNQWTSSDHTNFNNVKDFVRIVVDPNNNDRVFAGSWGFGVMELNKGAVVKLYNESNTDSALQAVVPGTDLIRIGGLAFDAEGNLWVTSTQVDHLLCVRTAAGSWYSFEFTGLGDNRVSDVLVDEQGYKWILLNKQEGGILVFDDNGTIANKNDDREQRLINAVGSGNVSLDVVSIAEDLDGEIWVGTNEGIYVFYSPSLIFTNDDYDAQRILVEQDGYFQYLLETEAVTAIAIDGANRKWLGTESAGVFLMSEDGTTELQHFTVDNSPLLSNNILSIAINQISGEVFFGTGKGIISYKGTSTEGAVTHTNVYAYPNPVREGYSGTIAINGLVTDADVKITDISGSLIYETKALGGRAIWDGKNFSGDKAQTGVYLVFATNDLGTETVVTKILFIN